MLRRLIRSSAAAVFALGLAMPATPAAADAPSTMSYQGVLSDPSGTLVPDNDYAMTFRLYDVSAGGAALWSESYAAVTVKAGLFHVLLGSTTPLSLAFDKPLWLSLQVGADPEMSPRVPLASAPYAMGLRLPLDATQSSASPSFAVRNGNVNSVALLVDHVLDVGTSVNEGRLRLAKGASLTGYGLTLDDFGGATAGGQILGFNGAGAVTYSLQPDADGSGGFLAVRRGGGSTGFTVDGNYLNTGDPRLSISGTAGSAVFNMNETDDAAVVLPANSIQQAEIGDEAGIASIDESVSQSLTGGISTILSRTITVPEIGFVVAIGSFDAEMGHTSGTASRIIAGINVDQNLAFSSITRVPWVEANAPSGEYRFPTSVNEVFAVGPGSHTFYLLGQEVSTVGFANDASLTLMYFTTGYGTVAKSGDLATKPGEEPKRDGRTAAEIAAEQAEHQRERLASIQRQLDALRASAPAEVSNDAPRR